jgi:inward rectifier potassium channel
MRNPSFDPGLTQQFTAPLRRVIEKDGTFNVLRRGASWRDVHPYLYLVNQRWPAFLATLFAAYLTANVLFAAGYYAVGTGGLQGADAPTAAGRFLKAFFFSAHTLSTVGYGSISPIGTGANVLASFESMAGVLGFAIATGLLYGRFSRPSARLGFSETMTLAPYQEGESLQFRVVNRRRNSLMDLEARVMLMTVDGTGPTAKRNYNLLRLERSQVMFLPLTWTVVHPIDSESPFWGKTAGDLERQQAEILIVLKGYDDTFNQTVLSRHSYRHEEIVWGRRFAPAFRVDEQGDLVLEIQKVGELA